MDKLPLFKFFLCCLEAGEMDEAFFAKTISLIVEDEDFAKTALAALEQRLADHKAYGN